MRGDHVELCQLLKLTGVADNAGQAGQMVVDDLVRVDGRAEHRKRAKIRAGQTVDCLDTRIAVVAEGG